MVKNPKTKKGTPKPPETKNALNQIYLLPIRYLTTELTHVKQAILAEMTYLGRKH